MSEHPEGSNWLLHDMEGLLDRWLLLDRLLYLATYQGDIPCQLAQSLSPGSYPI